MDTKNPGPSGRLSPQEPGHIANQYINPSALGVNAHLSVMMIMMEMICIGIIGHSTYSRCYDFNPLPLACQVILFTN